MDSVITAAGGAIRHSVYRIAAGGSSPPGEPKLPWPSTIGSLIAHGCTIRTRAS
jgi:hypothetical protein